MASDLNRVPALVEQIFTAELPSGVATVAGHVVWWRNLDDIDANSQEPDRYPLIELEFGENTQNRRNEYGAPGENRWTEGPGFMVHVHVDRHRHDMRLARAVMGRVVDLLCGRQFSSPAGAVSFGDALAAFVDDGTGLSRGVSRAFQSQYDYRGR